MKKFLSTLLLIFISAITITLNTGCRKMSHNGNLDGQWQILSIEDRKSGSINVLSDQRYYCINLHVIQLTTYGGIKYSGNFHYDKDKEEITFDFPYQAAQISQGNNPLIPFGIYTNPVTFKIIESSSKELILSSPESIVTFRKF